LRKYLNLFYYRMNKPVVLSFGELLWDLLPDGPVLGGAPANFSANLANLSVNTALISSVGKDSLGQEALKQLREVGLNVQYVQQDGAAPTGTVAVTMSGQGTPSYEIISNVAYDNIQDVDCVTADFDSVRLICFGTLIQRNRVSQSSLEKLLEELPHSLKLLDINLRPNCFSRSTVDWSLQRADILKLNDAEVLEVSNLLLQQQLSIEAFCDFVFTHYEIQTVLITRGADGVYARNRTGAVVDIAGCKVNVIDTIGAGDAFTAGFVYRLLAGDNLETCCEFGNRLGAFVAGKKGGIVAYSQAEVAELTQEFK
jgi:fructokinase